MRIFGKSAQMAGSFRSIVVAVCLLTMVHAAFSATREPTMTAVALLTAFSGDDAQQYQPFFEFSEKSRIVGVEVHAVGVEETTARYSGQEGAWHEVNNILRISTADGFEGISGVDTYYQGDFSDAHLQVLLSAAADLVNFESLDPLEVMSRLEELRPDLGDEVRSSIDIALWDLAARKAGQPLYRLLGAKRNCIQPYASLPFYDSLPEYVDAVRRYAKLGYTIFKFHVWGSIEQDIRLVELIQNTFSDSPYRFMIDLEMAYDLDDALRLGRQMDKGLFVSLEAPMKDELLQQYAELRRELAILIIPAGYSIYTPEYLRQGIDAGAWDAGRFDATVVGGISSALGLLAIANDFDLTIDIQSWGHSLAQAANLHLMLANERTRYFEAPMPGKPFEFGMKNGNFLRQGNIVAPAGYGLAVDVDWSRLPAADFYVHGTLGELTASGEPRPRIETKARE